MSEALFALKNRYGIDVLDITGDNSGWSSQGYKVHSPDGTFFLKEYSRLRPSVLPWIQRMDAYLPVQALLQEIPELCLHMPLLRHTVGGELKVELGNAVYLLFSYVEGHTLGDTLLTPEQARELGRIMATLHALRAVPGHLLENLAEDLNLPFAVALQNCLTDLAKLPARLKHTLGHHAAVLSDALTLLFKLRDDARNHCSRLVLCHTDAHGFNLMQGTHLTLLDWEGLCLAPAEADLFLLTHQPHFGLFLEEYASHSKGFCLNRQLLQYYHMRRQLEDIFEFLQQILRDETAPATLESAYSCLESLCAKSAGLIRARQAGAPETGG